MPNTLMPWITAVNATLQYLLAISRLGTYTDFFNYVDTKFDEIQGG